MRIDYIIQSIVAAVLVALMVWMLQSCKVQDCIPETIVRDSVRTEYKLDSVYIYQHDSVFIKEKKDTIFVEKYITRYKDVLKVERDTVWQESVVEKVQEVRYVPAFVKWLAWTGAGAIVLLLLWVVLKVYRKFVLKV